MVLDIRYIINRLCKRSAERDTLQMATERGRPDHILRTQASVTARSSEDCDRAGSPRKFLEFLTLQGRVETLFVMDDLHLPQIR